jgi:hypothetical protein
MILAGFGRGKLVASYGQFPADGVFQTGRVRRHGHHVVGRLDSPQRENCRATGKVARTL